jgi:hypothetical protein
MWAGNYIADLQTVMAGNYDAIASSSGLEN